MGEYKFPSWKEGQGILEGQEPNNNFIKKK